MDPTTLTTTLMLRCLANEGRELASDALQMSRQLTDLTDGLLELCKQLDRVAFQTEEGIAVAADSGQNRNASGFSPQAQDDRGESASDARASDALGEPGRAQSDEVVEAAAPEEGLPPPGEAGAAPDVPRVPRLFKVPPTLEPHPDEIGLAICDVSFKHQSVIGPHGEAQFGRMAIKLIDHLSTQYALRPWDCVRAADYPDLDVLWQELPALQSRLQDIGLHIYWDEQDQTFQLRRLAEVA